MICRKIILDLSINCTKENTSQCPIPHSMTDQEFSEKQISLLKNIPVEFHNALSYSAWEMGHSAGYEEVIGILSDLVGSFEDPIKKFEARIRSEK